MQNTAPHPLLAPQRSDAKILKICFLCALTAHIVVLVLPFKQAARIPEPPTDPGAVAIVPFEFEPPEIAVRSGVEVEPTTRRIAIPTEDPDVEMLEPVDEMVFQDLPAVPDGDGEPLLLDDPEPPDPGIHDSWERDLVLPVRLQGSVDPDYPRLGVLSRTGGVVILEAVVDESGRVVDLQVLRAPAPDPGFSQAALEAVAAWRYRPGTVNGRPVAVRMSVRVEFSLR